MTSAGSEPPPVIGHDLEWHPELTLPRAQPEAKGGDGTVAEERFDATRLSSGSPAADLRSLSESQGVID